MKLTVLVNLAVNEKNVYYDIRRFVVDYCLFLGVVGSLEHPLVAIVVLKTVLLYRECEAR